MSVLPPPGEMRISVAHFQEYAVVRVWGELDISSAPRLKRVLEAVQRASASVALDISAVGFIDSTGLYTFVEANRRATVDDGRFVVVGALPNIRRIMGIAGLEQVLSFAPDLSSLNA